MNDEIITNMISIIIPIYNREEYLHKCILSVLNQKNVDMEIILIDDGSTDASGAIIDDYARNNPNVVAIHQKNKGLSAARNAGLDICRGEYIFFLDSDDSIADNALSSLLVKMKEMNVDICIGNYSKFYDNGELESTNLIPNNLQNKIVHPVDVLSMMYDIESYLWEIIWGKLYKRDIFQNIRFPEGRNYEDEYVISDIMENTTKVYILDEVIYYQTLSKGSIMRSKFKLSNLDSTDSIIRTINYFINKEYYDFALFRFGEGTRKLIYWKKEHRESDVIKEIDRQVTEYRKIAKRLIPHVKLSEKIRLLLFCISFEVYDFVRDFLRG
ncbi:glycosyltransferase family 2 protein [Butyrivibrio sp. AE3004]|uniref:glycosyltransferase family 2 protein n=1 Tax=Butyrivibrio sp. AE3004 TaxID=1506994 RepID=UPI0006919F4B|nr:glycosyltransferase [Butyrivibrio sp. AE3004]